MDHTFSRFQDFYLRGTIVKWNSKSDNFSWNVLFLGDTSYNQQRSFRFVTFIYSYERIGYLTIFDIYEFCENVSPTNIDSFEEKNHLASFKFFKKEFLEKLLHRVIIGDLRNKWGERR